MLLTKAHRIDRPITGYHKSNRASIEITRDISTEEGAEHHTLTPKTWTIVPTIKARAEQAGQYLVLHGTLPELPGETKLARATTTTPIDRYS